MKNSVIAFSAASVLVISLIIIGTFKTGIVSALTATTTDATSTASDTTTASTSPASASSTTPATDASSTSVTPPAQTQAPAQSQAQSQPSSKPTLKLVHVVGTKYIDYFTDGTKTYSFPGNPDIDRNLNKPNAPIPTHGNLQWVSTSGMEAYDTPSGDLEIRRLRPGIRRLIHQQCPRLHLHRRNLQRSHRGTHRDLENRPNRGSSGHQRRHRIDSATATSTRNSVLSRECYFCEAGFPPSLRRATPARRLSEGVPDEFQTGGA